MATVLVVDDSRTMLLIMRKLLGDFGHEVVAEAANGKEAIVAYETHNPDLVTMDINMPVMDGVTAVQQIVKRHPDAKVIMVSAYGHSKMVLKAIAAGAKHFLVKPIIAERARKVIDEVLAGSASSAAGDLDALQTAPFSIEKKSAGFVVRIREQLDKPGATALQQALEDLNFSGNLQITLQFPDKVGYSPSISARIYSAVKKLQSSGIKVSIQTADAAFKAHLQM
ncbi:MAG: response regulator [Candidatus Marinimicrobia bacterium]|nr:response regulator [Candidatus Neomarinimicrobiota bacterium]